MSFLAPTHGVAQYTGALHLVMGARCLGAIGVPGFPSRDRKECLQDIAIYHGAAAAIALYRTVRGAQFSLAIAATTPLPGAVAMATLSYLASR